MSMAFTPVVGDIRPSSRSLINHLQTDQNRAIDRSITREQWTAVGVVTALAFGGGSAILMIGAPLALALGGTSITLLAVATAAVSAISARKNEKMVEYLAKRIDHLEKGGLAQNALEEINKDEKSFFKRLSNRRMEKAAQRANPMLKIAVKHGL